MAQAAENSMRKVYRTYHEKVKYLLAPYPDLTDSLDPVTTREKQRLVEEVKELIHCVLELEESLANMVPFESEALVLIEISKLETELREKNELIRKVRGLLEKWTQDLVPDNKNTAAASSTNLGF